MSKKVLLVDDDPDILAFLETTLGNQLGCETIKTDRPSGVIELVRESRPDLIICDIDMDERPGGQVAVDLASDDIGRDVPLVFLSARIDESVVNQDGTVEGVWMLSKSSPPEEIVDRIRQILEGESAS